MIKNIRLRKVITYIMVHLPHSNCNSLSYRFKTCT